WQELILEYSPDKQEGMAEDLWEDLVSNKGATARRLRRAAVLVGLPLLGCLGVLVVRRWRRTPRRRPAARGGPVVPFYARLLAILERYCRLRPRPAQTPQEFAALVPQYLAGRALAQVPLRLAAL